MTSYPTTKDNDISLLKKIVENTAEIGSVGGGSGDAGGTTYDNTTSGLTAEDVQAAIDEVVAELETRIESIENSTTDGQVIVFNGASGKSGKKASGTGVANLVSGVLGTATIGNGLTYSGTTLSVSGIPQNSQSAAYGIVESDANKHIYHPSADTTARTFTIPANASVAFPIGTTLTFVNDSSAGVLTIAITSDTLVLAGTGSTGSRTLAADGVATAIKVTSTRWQINGTNLS
jgi:hypothetical protein